MAALQFCQIPKRFLGHLELMPIGVDFGAESFVKLDAALIPFRYIPFDHAAASLLRFLRESLH